MKQPLFDHVRGWFTVTDAERWVLAAALGLFLLGLLARNRALRRERAAPADLPGLEWVEEEIGR